jgi:hypothetical protein
VACHGMRRPIAMFIADNGMSVERQAVKFMAQ